MVVKIEVMQIRDAPPKHFHLRIGKGDLKGFQTNFETFLQVSVTI